MWGPGWMKAEVPEASGWDGYVGGGVLMQGCDNIHLNACLFSSLRKKGKKEGGGGVQSQTTAGPSAPSEAGWL